MVDVVKGSRAEETVSAVGLGRGNRKWNIRSVSSCTCPAVYVVSWVLGFETGTTSGIQCLFIAVGNNHLDVSLLQLS